MHARDLFVFSSYVTLISLQCVPFSLYQNMGSLVLDLIDLTTDKIVSNTKCFHAKLSAKLAFVTYPWASSFYAG